MSDIFSDICYLCLKNYKDLKIQSIKSRDNDGIIVRNKLKYLIPEYIYFAPKIRKYVCEECLNEVNRINQFRDNCLRSIRTLEEYLRTTQRKRRSCLDVINNIKNKPERFKSLGKTDQSNQISEILSDEADSSSENELQAEKSETILTDIPISEMNLDIVKFNPEKILERELSSKKLSTETVNDAESKIQYIVENKSKISPEVIYNPDDESGNEKSSENRALNSTIPKIIYTANNELKNSLKDRNNDFIINQATKVKYTYSKTDLEIEKSPKNSDNIANNHVKSKTSPEMISFPENESEDITIVENTNVIVKKKSDLNINSKKKYKLVIYNSNNAQKSPTSVGNNVSNESGIIIVKKPKNTYLVPCVKTNVIQTIQNLETKYTSNVCKKSNDFNIPPEGILYDLSDENSVANSVKWEAEKAEHIQIYIQEEHNYLNDLQQSNKFYLSEEYVNIAETEIIGSDGNYLSNETEEFTGDNNLSFGENANEIIEYTEKNDENKTQNVEKNTLKYIASEASLAQNEKRPHQCFICGRRFGRKSLLNDHYIVHTNERPFKCTQCDGSFKRKRYLKEHMEIHSGIRPYGCQICNKTFAQASVYSAHKRWHKKRNQKEPAPVIHKCSVCLKEFENDVLLEAHMSTSHRVIQCEICKAHFSHLKIFERHMMVHNGTVEPEIFYCNSCPKKFGHKANLLRHKMEHSKTRPFKCPYCDKGFFQNYQLGDHIRTHTGDRPFMCSACGKTYIHQKDLDKHMLIHSEDKKYKCKICPYETARGDYLKRHEKTHTGIKDYCCKYCYRRFSKLDNMKNHVKKIHNTNITK